MELFVYVSRFVKDERRSPPQVLLLSADENEEAVVLRSWSKFDSRACHCFDTADETRP
jgi:hypothetical protein